MHKTLNPSLAPHPSPPNHSLGPRRAISKDIRAFHPNLKGPTVEGREKQNSTSRASLTAAPANVLPPTQDPPGQPSEHGALGRNSLVFPYTQARIPESPSELEGTCQVTLPKHEHEELKVQKGKGLVRGPTVKESSQSTNLPSASHSWGHLG